jgi:hypothetical protein
MGDEDFWYERTAYRKIPKSLCVDGIRPDRGTEHICPGFRAHGALFWWTLLFVPFGFTALVAFWYYRRGGYRRGFVFHSLPEPLNLTRSSGLFAFPIPTHSRIPGLSPPLLRYHGLSLELLGLLGAMWRLFLSSHDRCSAREEDIGMYPLTKMHRFCGSKTRINYCRCGIVTFLGALMSREYCRIIIVPLTCSQSYCHACWLCSLTSKTKARV